MLSFYKNCDLLIYFFFLVSGNLSKMAEVEEEEGVQRLKKLFYCLFVV